jgi:PilZ domain
MLSPRGSQKQQRGSSRKAELRRLKRALRSNRDWLNFYDTRIANTVFCSTSRPPSIGARVEIDLLIYKGPRLKLEGQVTWRRVSTKNQRMEPGVRIRVSNAQRKLLDRVDAWRRSGVRNRRLHRRLPVRLRATYTTVKLRRRVNFVYDLSPNGLFLAASRLVPPDSAVRLTVIPPGEASPQSLTGRVARCVEEPEGRGMGIELSFDDTFSEQRYIALVEQLEQKYISGELSQRHLA